MLNNFQIEWIYQVLLATLLGAIIGYERHYQSKEAGIRTHTLVAMGSAILVIISKYGFIGTEHYDTSRVAASIISGIGFLGAGVIFVRKDVIHGLTTAAGIWTTSAIGMCAGAGLYILAVISAVLMLIIQLIFKTDSFRRIPKTNATLLIRVSQGTSIRDLDDAFKSLGYLCLDNKIVKDQENDAGWIILSEIVSQKDIEPEQLLEEMRKKEFIKTIEIH